MSKKTALEFVAAVNAHDVGRIVALMSDDHAFVDAYGGVESAAAMAEGWPDYFAWFPDYRIEVEQIMEDGDTVGLFGFAGGSWHGRPGAAGENRWRLPAVWRVVTAGDKVKVWQVYCDSKIPYEIIGRNGGPS